MSRRDTIIIAVLINAGLLAILFVMAVNTNDEKIAEHPAVEQALVHVQPSPQRVEIPASTSMETSPADEFDRVLNHLAVNEPSQPIIIDELPNQETKVVSEATQVGLIPPSQKENEVACVDVTVKRGDSLEKISKANGTTVTAIMKANNLKSEKLKIGQVLHVPMAQKKESKPSTPVITKTSDSEEVEYYVIKSGDNPWKIAKQFHVKLDDLLKLNNFNEEKARNLKVGDKIRIR